MKKRELEELKELYPRTFDRCYKESDIANKLDDLNKSRDVYYDKNNIKKGDHYDEVEGYFVVELGNNNTPIKVYVDVYLEGFDEEEGIYTIESNSKATGWNYLAEPTKLSIIRKSKGLSQSQLANKADVNLRTLQDYEQGKKDINAAAAITVYRLSVALGCEVKDLLEI